MLKPVKLIIYSKEDLADIELILWILWFLDLSFQLSVKPWRRPLTMGNQSSEMKSQYAGKPGVNLDTVYNAGIQPFNLADHHREGNSKVLCL